MGSAIDKVGPKDPSWSIPPVHPSDVIGMRITKERWRPIQLRCRHSTFHGVEIVELFMAEPEDKGAGPPHRGRHSLPAAFKTYASSRLSDVVVNLKRVGLSSVHVLRRHLQLLSTRLDPIHRHRERSPMFEECGPHLFRPLRAPDQKPVRPRARHTVAGGVVGERAVPLIAVPATLNLDLARFQMAADGIEHPGSIPRTCRNTGPYRHREVQNQPGSGACHAAHHRSAHVSPRTRCESWQIAFSSGAFYPLQIEVPLASGAIRPRPPHAALTGDL